MESLIAKISIMLVPGLFAITLHEVSHGYVADKLGDPTARLLGRLTLNPFRHLDPIGTLALLFFGFGWAKPVPVNFHNLRRPKNDMIWVALAGPLTNFSLAVLSALLLRSLGAIPESWLAAWPTLGELQLPLTLMASFSLYINLILGLFNLLPIPPLDGGRVLAGLLPDRQGAVLARLEPFGFILLILLVFFTGLWQRVFFPVVMGLSEWLAGPYLLAVRKASRYLIGF